MQEVILENLTVVQDGEEIFVNGRRLTPDEKKPSASYLRCFIWGWLVSFLSILLLAYITGNFPSLF